MNKKDIIQFFNTLPDYNSQEFSLKITQEILTSSTDVETLVNLLKEILDEYKNKDNEIINNKKLAFAACYALIVLYRRYDEQFKIKKLTDDFNSLFEDIPLFISEKSRICVEIGNNNDLKKALKLGKKSIELLEGKEHAGIFNNYSEIIALNLEKNTKRSEELLEEGYKYIFRVDPKAFADPKTWIFALGQAFFSLSVAGNGTLIYGSYLSDNEDIPAAAGRVALFDTIAALLAALVIIPAMATTGAQLNQGGPGLMFIFLPALFKSMPGGYIVAIIFFVAVFMAGLSSLINLYEAPIATIQEKLHLGRKASCAIIAVIALVVSICIQGIVSGWMDILSIYICPLGAGLAGIMFFWICGKKYVETQVNTGRDKKFTDKFYPICKYIFCPVCFLVLILGIVLGGIG